MPGWRSETPGGIAHSSTRLVFSLTVSRVKSGASAVTQVVHFGLPLRSARQYARSIDRTWCGRLHWRRHLVLARDDWPDGRAASRLARRVTRPVVGGAAGDRGGVSRHSSPAALDTGAVTALRLRDSYPPLVAISIAGGRSDLDRPDHVSRVGGGHCRSHHRAISRPRNRRSTPRAAGRGGTDARALWGERCLAVADPARR